VIAKLLTCALPNEKRKHFHTVGSVLKFQSKEQRKKRQLDLQLPLKAVYISIKVMSFNPSHGEVYLIQRYAIKFVSDLRQVGGFLSNCCSIANKTDLHDITEI
jgi:hypothetical protein